jgi:hypothetical protein
MVGYEIWNHTSGRQRRVRPILYGLDVLGLHMIYQLPNGIWRWFDGSSVVRDFATEQEAFMAEQGTSIERWYAASVALSKQALALIDATATPQRQYAYGVEEQILATIDGADVVPGISKAQAQEMAALWDAFKAWMPNAIANERAHGKSPLQILTEQGMG